LRALIRRVVSRFPERLRQRLARLRQPRLAYLILARTQPLSRSYGTDRGSPVDRYYIEHFLEENRRYIRGACLEVLDGGYTSRYGSGVTRMDVLDINRSNPHATVYGDLRRLDSVADDSYDCFIITQVFQYIDDVEAAVHETARILRPGGTALVSLPTLCKLEPRHPQYWRFTPLSAKYLFGKYFHEDHLEIRAWGNVLTGLAVWVGLAQEDLRKKHLEQHDPEFPCTITVRATKRLKSAL
jgi:SAM-dependent methyltransferase